jgi:hypothetical protein
VEHSPGPEALVEERVAGERAVDVQQTRKQAAALLGSIITDAKRLKDLLISNEPSAELLSHIHKFKHYATELLSSGHLDTISNAGQAAIRSAFDDLPLTLKHFCEANEYRLSGAFPDYIVNGVVYLGINAESHSALINDSKIPLFPLKDVFKQLTEQLAQFKKEAFDEKMFLEHLHEAYDSCLLKQFALEGSGLKKRVSIFTLLAELAFSNQSKAFLKNPTQKLFKPYSQHKFRADLFRLFNSETSPKWKGNNLILEPTSVAENGLFMYLPATGRCLFVGHVIFAAHE